MVKSTVLNDRLVHDGATSLRAMMAKLEKPLAAFSHCEKTDSFQSPFPLCVPPPARRWLLICPVRKNSAGDLAERGLSLSAVPVPFPPHISDYTSVQRRIQSFSPTNHTSFSATSPTIRKRNSQIILLGPRYRQRLATKRLLSRSRRLACSPKSPQIGFCHRLR